MSAEPAAPATPHQVAKLVKLLRQVPVPAAPLAARTAERFLAPTQPALDEELVVLLTATLDELCRHCHVGPYEPPPWPLPPEAHS